MNFRGHMISSPENKYQKISFISSCQMEANRVWIGRLESSDHRPNLLGLTLKGWISDRGNTPFWNCVTSSTS